MLAHLADVSIRSIFLALVAALALLVVRGRRTAALQHAIWAAVMCGMLALFAFGQALPRLPLHVLRSATEPAALPTVFPLPLADSNSVTVHLVNLTNPMAMKGPYRDFFPVGPQVIRLRLPGKLQAKRARLLTAAKDVVIEGSGSTLSITVPSVLDHEVVAIDI